MSQPMPVQHSRSASTNAASVELRLAVEPDDQRAVVSGHAAHQRQQLADPGRCFRADVDIAVEDLDDLTTLIFVTALSLHAIPVRSRTAPSSAFEFTRW